MRIYLARSPEHLHSVYARHAKISQKKVGALRFKQTLGFLRLAGRNATVAGRVQEPHPSLSHVGLVVQDEYVLCCHGHL
jgi:hypothetical protein